MRSISFSDLLIPRVLDGSKTMTRRPINPQPAPDLKLSAVLKSYDGEPTVARFWKTGTKPNDPVIYDVRCKYGNPGDVLYVKETHYVYGRWYPNGHTDNGGTRWKFLPYPDEAVRFDKPDDVHPNTYRKDGWYKRNALFMPASYARLFLRIEDIRVERLNQISEEDAIAEGVERIPVAPFIVRYLDYSGKQEYLESAAESFRTLWESIYGPGTFDDRFVFVVKFSKTENP